MRFNLSISPPVVVLAAISSTAAACAAVCPKTLLPGPAEVAWSLVFNRDVADNVMFCGYQGAGRNNSKPQTFCTYNDNDGKIIPNDLSLLACPKTVPVVNCDK
ncbi:hypothetical protein B0H14DRAFT_2680551 [Mycena olivaceomarginata]|nr:hypothetical protein B0H14DRAFT_2680551 [Mycena olivaceomarginata]